MALFVMPIVLLLLYTWLCAWLGRKVKTGAGLERISLIGATCALLAAGLLLGAHLINDRLMPPGISRRNDITPSYLYLGGGCLLLLCTMWGVFLVKSRALVPLERLAGTLVLTLVATVVALTGAGYCALAALGDWDGGFNGFPLCRIGEEVSRDGYPSCVPSHIADQLQLPLHIVAACLLLLVAALTVVVAYIRVPPALSSVYPASYSTQQD